MDQQNSVKKIAIIGAGWLGIGCLRILQEEGYEIDVYEQLDDIGGVWHPSNAYINLAIHDSARGIEFFDFPLPDSIDRTERISSAEVFHYLKAYCQEKKFYDCMHFNITVDNVSYFKQRKKSTLTLKDKDNNVFESSEYDYVIYTNGFSNRGIPEFKDSNKFAGHIIHSFDATETYLKQAIAENKKITVLGASKTAVDLIIALHHLNYNAKWLYRKAYWFLNYSKLQRILKAKKLNKNNITGFLFKLFFSFGAFLIYVLDSWNLTYWLWRIFGIIHTYGERHKDFTKYHNGLLDEQQIKIATNYNQKNGIVDEIEKLERQGIKLKSGNFVETDVLICCTGSGNGKSLIRFFVDGVLIDPESIYVMYNSIIIPQIPNLIFTCYTIFGAGVMNALFHGAWISNYIKSNLDSDYLLKNAKKYEYPFLFHQPTFNSSTNIMLAQSRQAKELINEKQITFLSLFCWVINKVIFGVYGTRPPKFKKPPDKK